MATRMRNLPDVKADPEGPGSVREGQMKKLLDFCSLLSTKIDYQSLLDTILQQTGNQE